MPQPSVDSTSFQADPEDPRVVRTREAVDQAVWDLVVERQTIELPLADIARRARVSRQTLYDHFAHRGAVVADVAQAKLQAVIDAARANDQLKRRDLTCAVLTHLRERAPFYLPVFTGRNEAFLRRFEDFMAHDYLESRPPFSSDRCEVQTVAYFFAGGAITIISRWLSDASDHGETAGQLADRLDRLGGQVSARLPGPSR